MSPSVTPSQAHTLEVTEKVTSILSVVGASFIIGTFLLDSRFRKPINRLVFYAAWGNLFANVGTLISRSGINLGVNSPLCQFQAFLIQWFLPADALWTFAMACNVYLSFFHQFDSAQLKGLEWKYLGACYGVPFIPAIVFLFVNTPSRGKVFGSAALWCWISPDWNVLRIAVFYGPVWIVILTTIFIYIRVGMVVFRWRKQLLSLDNSGPKGSSGHRNFPMKDIPSPAAMSQPRYEVTITSQVPHSPTDWKDGMTSPRNVYGEDTSPKSPTSTHARFSSLPDATYPPPHTNVVVQRPPIRLLDANKATLSYCKTAMLFFFALLCTWVPSTINRVNTLVHPDDSVFGLDLASALVLPLQGFWNTLIYIVTSWAACKALWGEMRTRLFDSGAPRPNRSLPSSLNISTKFNNHRTLGSDDTRADITMRMDGKNRVIEHNYRNSLHGDEDDYIGGQPRRPSLLP